MTGSIQRRLVIGAGLGLALVFAIVGAVVDVLARRALTDQFDAALAARARALAVLVEQDGAAVETDLDDRLLPELADGHGLWVELAVDGAVMYRSAPQAPRGARAVRHRFAPRQEADGPPTPARAAVLTVAQATAPLDDAIAGVRTALALAGIVGLALCLGVIAWLGRFTTAPLRRLADQIDAVDETDPTARFDGAGAPAELRRVVERLDGLVERVAAALARERELTAEIAHELRTPLAGMSATLEVALDRERPPARYQDSLREVLAICGQTQQVIESLLMLARLDRGAAAAKVDGDLAALVTAAIDRADPATRGLQVTATIPAAAPVRTDPALVAIVLANLVDNAIAHAEPGGQLVVSIVDGRTVRIANTGSRIAAADAPRVVQRFWRGDRARAVGAHAGLGLALCQKIADVLGARLRIASELGGWFTVELELPVQNRT